MVCNYCDRKVHAKSMCYYHYRHNLRHGDPIKKKPRISTMEQWLIEHKDYNSVECLIWPFAKSKGYGQYRLNWEKISAHAKMCELAHGKAPIDKPWALHSCFKGHLGCVTPNHIYWGTRSENIRDMQTEKFNKRKLK